MEKENENSETNRQGKVVQLATHVKTKKLSELLLTTAIIRPVFIWATRYR